MVCDEFPGRRIPKPYAHVRIISPFQGDVFFRIDTQGVALGWIISALRAAPHFRFPLTTDVDPSMPQSLSKILVHLIFSTKNRAPLILKPIRPELRKYMS